MGEKSLNQTDRSEAISATLVSLPNEKLKVENDKIYGNDFDENELIKSRFGIELNSTMGLIKIDEAKIEAKKGTFTTTAFSSPMQ